MAVAIDPRVLARVRGEYEEMPGLRLTIREAARLWGMEQGACASVLQALVERRVLTRTRDGAFIRSGE
jgi:hypothetical protein